MSVRKPAIIIGIIICIIICMPFAFVAGAAPASQAVETTEDRAIDVLMQRFAAALDGGRFDGGERAELLPLQGDDPHGSVTRRLRSALLKTPLRLFAGGRDRERVIEKIDWSGTFDDLLVEETRQKFGKLLDAEILFSGTIVEKTLDDGRAGLELMVAAIRVETGEFLFQEVVVYPRPRPSLPGIVLDLARRHALAICVAALLLLLARGAWKAAARAGMSAPAMTVDRAWRERVRAEFDKARDALAGAREGVEAGRAKDLREAAEALESIQSRVSASPARDGGGARVDELNRRIEETARQATEAARGADVPACRELAARMGELLRDRDNAAKGALS